MRLSIVERRGTVRIKTGLCVQFKQQDNIWDICVIKDFSENGLRLTSQTKLEAGTILMFRMKIPIDPCDHIEFFAKVVDCQPMSEGLNGSFLLRAQMTNIPPAHLNIARSYVDWFYKNHMN